MLSLRNVFADRQCVVELRSLCLVVKVFIALFRIFMAFIVATVDVHGPGLGECEWL